MRLQGFRCFECNELAHHAHHVVPFSKGGTRTIPLCEGCHSKVHDHDLTNLSELVKAGMAKAKAKGVKLGRPKKTCDSQILKLKNQGLSYQQIANEFGVSKAAIYHRLRGMRK